MTNTKIIQSGQFKFHVREGTLDEYIVKENAYANKITLHKDDIWLDIGAHIGTFAFRFAPHVKKIYAFEPGADNWELLKANRILNKSKNVDLINAAIVGNDDIKRLFYLNTKMNTGSHSFMVRRGRTEVIVRCVNINEMIEVYKPNKLKLDVEGAEYEIIHAIKDWDSIEEIIFEFDFAKLKDKDHVKYFETLELLWAEGFGLVYNKDPKQTWHTVVYGRRNAV